MASNKSSSLYRERVYNIVGDQDPIEILSSTISIMKPLVSSLAPGQLQHSDGNSWSVNDILQHLVDAEMVNGYRLRMVMSVDGPVLPGYNQDFWVERFNLKRTLKSVLQDWTLMRAYNLRIIQTLTPGELDREYQHMERGQETLRDLIHLMAGHDLIHLQQVKRILDQL